jgi:hypothetical protein
MAFPQGTPAEGLARARIHARPILSHLRNGSSQRAHRRGWGPIRPTRSSPQTLEVLASGTRPEEEDRKWRHFPRSASSKSNFKKVR